LNALQKPTPAPTSALAVSSHRLGALPKRSSTSTVPSLIPTSAFVRLGRKRTAAEDDDAARIKRLEASTRNIFPVIPIYPENDTSKGEVEIVR